jgi:hypothetical protein
MIGSKITAHDDGHGPQPLLHVPHCLQLSCRGEGCDERLGQNNHYEKHKRKGHKYFDQRDAQTPVRAGLLRGHRI